MAASICLDKQLICLCGVILCGAVEANTNNLNDGNIQPEVAVRANGVSLVFNGYFTICKFSFVSNIEYAVNEMK